MYVGHALWDIGWDIGWIAQDSVSMNECKTSSRGMDAGSVD